MSSTVLFLIIVLAIVCLMIPVDYLILLSVLLVLFSDAPFISMKYLYYPRFVPAGVLFVRVIIFYMTRRKSLTGQNTMVLSWMPFLFMAFFSTLYAVDPRLTFLRTLSAFFIIVGFGMAIPAFIPDGASKRHFVWLIFLVLGASVFYSLVGGIGGGGEEAANLRGPEVRISGFFNNPNTVGLVAMQALMLALYLYNRAESKFKRNLYRLGMLGVGAVMLASGSRASVAGFLVAMVVYVFAMASIRGRTISRIMRVIMLIGVLMGTTLLIFPEFTGGLFRVASSGRLTLWERGWQLSQDSLFFGVGLGSGDIIFHRDIPYLRSRGIYVSGAHSSVIRALVDLGIAGVSIVALTLGYLLRRVWKNLGFFEDPQLGVFLLALVLGSLFNSLFESWLFGFGNSTTVPFWLCLTLLVHESDRAVLAKRSRSAVEVSSEPRVERRRLRGAPGRRPGGGPGIGRPAGLGGRRGHRQLPGTSP